LLLQLLASVVAEDPRKQAWLLTNGMLQLMERLVLHDDSGMEPAAFISKYSSSSSGSSSSSSSSSPCI